MRKLIAQRYRLQGVPTQADDIVITSGCLDALNLSLQALTQQGDYILLQQTVFYGVWQIAEKLGLNVVTLPDHPSGFDLVAFEQALQRYPIKVYWFILNCHNPLGFTVSPEIKQRIGELLAQYQVHLIEDDVYQELYYRGKKPLPMKAFDVQNWVLHCSSFSKILGANFRICWVHAGQFADKIQHLQLMSTISANALIQQALVEFISNHHYEKHLRHLRRHLEKKTKSSVWITYVSTCLQVVLSNTTAAAISFGYTCPNIWIVCGFINSYSKKKSALAQASFLLCLLRSIKGLGLIVRLLGAKGSNRR
ncbi:PLP-dependent aminotransferase family protein [Glaesserella parasuis]|uniref:aminotransferase-like domain-containing protein n=1 Tax=Glaesserella parasuis TaxID=738 RepID=UPI001921ACD0|nr:PLP-dependent aminotransferase family protein [Glaesserella parasuis]